MTGNEKLSKNGIDSVVYINLDKRTDKRDFMESQFKREGIDAVRFSAVSASFPFFEKDGSKHPLPRSGCYASHFSVWTELIKKQVRSAIVFEDDAILPHGFVDKVVDLKNKLDKDWLWVRLGWYNPMGYEVVEDRGNGLGKVHIPWCMNANLYSMKGLREIRRLALVPSSNVDPVAWILEKEHKHGCYHTLPDAMVGLSDHISDATNKPPYRG